MGEITSREVVTVDELVTLVSERTGIPTETAKTAVETVLGYLKEWLPEPIASQVDGLLGNAGSSGGIGGLFGKLGDMGDRSYRYFVKFGDTG